MGRQFNAALARVSPGCKSTDRKTRRERHEEERGREIRMAKAAKQHMYAQTKISAKKQLRKAGGGSSRHSLPTGDIGRRSG